MENGKRSETFWLPECYGGLYGPEGCYCPDESTLQERVETLETELAELRAELKSR